MDAFLHQVTMMEIDRISYIFGSFARRRQSQVTGPAKRRSIEPSHDRSKSTPHQTKKPPPSPASRPKSLNTPQPEDSKFKCPNCRKTFEDPRVLPCLHTFCLNCLKTLEQEQQASWLDHEQSLDGNKANSPDSQKGSSAGSGYISEPHAKGLTCPTCGHQSDMSTGGVVSLPPNYLLQHRMVLATLNNPITHLLCDICPSDVTATSRCMDCAVSFCDNCEEQHMRQKAFAGHQVLGLGEAREQGITRVRRQILCLKHPEEPIEMFCCNCVQVVCKECIQGQHKNHSCESIVRMAKSHIANLRRIQDKAKSTVEQSAISVSRLHAASKKFEGHCTKVQNEVEKFIDGYIKTMEDHRSQLLDQIKLVREDKLQHLNDEKLALHKKIKDARDVAYFLDDLLTEGSDVEVLTFVKPILQKLEHCNGFSKPEHELKVSESLQFLPKECVQYPDSFYPVFGVITTQAVSPQHCQLNTEGLHNIRVGRKVEILLEVRDSSDTPIEHGGERILAEVHHRDAGVSRSISVQVFDKRDGTYLISFVPDVGGKLALCVKVQGQQIKGSPFPIYVRSLKPHQGTFHCCTFCSSGGSKEATCGCGGKMPGGYKGCGHGHEGHPGRRHWSCCGNVLEHSECVRCNVQYQFTL